VLRDTTPGHPGTNVTISGTTDGTTGDQVDLRCFVGNSGTDLTTGVPVQPDGSFSFSGDVQPLDPGTCRLRAVPHNDLTAYPPDSNPADDVFKGPLMAVSHFEGFPAPTGDSAAGGFDAGAWQLEGEFNVTTAGGCGLSALVLDPITLMRSTNLFACDASFPTGLAGTPTLKVDGKEAFLPTQHAPGTAPVQSGVTLDSNTGTLTLTEVDPLHFGDGTSAGVVLRRSSTIGTNGRVANVADEWTSLDRDAHTLIARYDNRFSSPPPANDNSFKFPGDTGFKRYATNDPAGAASAPASIYVKGSDSAVDGNLRYPQGALTYSSPPSSVLFLQGSTVAAPSTGTEFEMDYSRSIPSSGAVDIKFAYSNGFTQQELKDDAAIAEHAFTLASGGGGAGGGGGGGGSAPTTGAGGTGTPGTGGSSTGSAATPTFSATGSASTKKSGSGFLVATGQTVKCPKGGAACTVTVTATGVVPVSLAAARTKTLVIGRAKFTVAAGHSRMLTFRLNRKGAAALRKLKRFVARVTLRAHAGSGKTVTRTRRLTVKLPRR
jgi:hypothetical protein